MSSDVCQASPKCTTGFSQVTLKITWRGRYQPHTYGMSEEQETERSEITFLITTKFGQDSRLSSSKVCSGTYLSIYYIHMQTHTHIFI